MTAVIMALTAWLFSWTWLAQPGDLDPGYWEQTPLPQIGLATFYAPGMMEYVQGYRRARGEIGECPQCVGTVALLRAGDIGRKVWLQPPGGERVGPFLVIDCARREDVAPLLARNWVVDVSYELGQLWGMDRPLDGVAVLSDPADEVGVDPMRPPTPFVVSPGAVVVTLPTPTAQATPLPPTPWPTRLPEPLPGVPTLPVEATVSAPVAPPLPVPLTPIITTPTPAATAPSSGPRGGESLTPVPPVLPGGTPISGDIAIGRPGSGLLGQSVALPGPVPSRAPAATAAASPRPVATPRATSSPILPDRPPASSAPVREESPLERLWRALMDLIRGR